MTGESDRGTDQDMVIESPIGPGAKKNGSFCLSFPLTKIHRKYFYTFLLAFQVIEYSFQVLVNHHTAPILLIEHGAKVRGLLCHFPGSLKAVFF